MEVARGDLEEKLGCVMLRGILSTRVVREIEIAEVPRCKGTLVLM